MMRGQVSLLDPEEDERSCRIIRAARTIAGHGKVFHVLADTPEQCEDLLILLVDEGLVIRFELPRQGKAVWPRDVETYPVNEFRYLLSQRERVKLNAAVASARAVLSRLGTPPSED